MQPSKKNVSDIKRRKKMNKLQMQLAIIKKKELDAKAQTIVERLLEPDVDSGWMLENLIHINKCHMEDVIEERAIEKMCGYALCENPLTKVISQRYHISTAKNKVYDLTRRKNFCSSICFCAANYLLEQMLTNPLWLRTDENILKFKLLPKSEENDVPGEEIIYKNLIDADESIHDVQENFTEETNNEVGTELPTVDKRKTKSVSFQLPDEKEPSPINHRNSDKTFITPIVVKNVIANYKLSTFPSKLTNNQRKESKFQKERNLSKKDFSNSDTIGTLVKRIENVLKEWITENTLRLLFGKESEKQKILQSLKTHEKYVALCENLNKLQFEDESDQQQNAENTVSKAVPNYSVLREEGKNLELKVRAFYKGSMIKDEYVPDKGQSEEDDNVNSVTPLVDSQAPNTVRRVIFVDKVNNVLQDLLRDLTKHGQCMPPRFAHSKERVRIIKELVSTFALTPENVVFKSFEWTLVGLIIIKTLSLMDPQLTCLLSTKETSLYVSMILMSYQLDSQYLDTFISSLREKQNKQLYIDNTVL